MELTNSLVAKTINKPIDEPLDRYLYRYPFPFYVEPKRTYTSLLPICIVRCKGLVEIPQEKVKFIKENYATMKNKEIAQALDISIACVLKYRREFALRKSKEIPKLNLSEFERGYLAGLIDTDGSIYITPMGRNYVASVDVVINTNPRIVRKAHSIVGFGHIYQSRQKWKSQSKRWNECYRLVLRQQPQIIALLEKIKDDLIVRKEQAELMIEYCCSRLSHNYKSYPYTEKERQICREMKVLNKRGK